MSTINQRFEMATILHDAMFPEAEREDRMTWPSFLNVAVSALSEAGYGKLADAWDEGRASIALDFLNPVGANGTRQSSTNPYRAEGIK